MRARLERRLLSRSTSASNTSIYITNDADSTHTKSDANTQGYATVTAVKSIILCINYYLQYLRLRPQSSQNTSATATEQLSNKTSHKSQQQQRIM